MSPIHSINPVLLCEPRTCLTPSVDAALAAALFGHVSRSSCIPAPDGPLPATLLLIMPAAVNAAVGLCNVQNAQAKTKACRCLYLHDSPSIKMSAATARKQAMRALFACCSRSGPVHGGRPWRITLRLAEWHSPSSFMIQDRQLLLLKFPC